MKRKSLEKRFTEASDEYLEALDDARHQEMLLKVYSSSFDNPISDSVDEARRSFSQTISAFGPLLKEAIEAGHHGRWVKRRLPDDFILIITNYEYAAVVWGSIGVCVETTIARSGISSLDRFVAW